MNNNDKLDLLSAVNLVTGVISDDPNSSRFSRASVTTSTQFYANKIFWTFTKEHSTLSYLHTIQHDSFLAHIGVFSKD